MKKKVYAIFVIATMIYCSLVVTGFAICMLIGIVSNQVTIGTVLAIFVNILIGICAYFVWGFTICITREYYEELWKKATTVTDNFSLEEFINHVKVSGILTEEGREYIDVRDVRLIIEMIKNQK